MARVRIKGADGKTNFVTDAVIKNTDPIYSSGGVKDGETYVDYQLRTGGTLVDDPTVKINEFDVGNVKGTSSIAEGGYTPQTTGNDVAKALASQVTGTTPTTTSSDTDLSADISNQYAQNTSALVSALKQRIAESTASQQSLIDKAPQTYDPYRASSEVQKAQSLRSVLEQSANAGDRGGVGRQQALTTQTEGANRLNDIDLQQQNYIDTGNAEIARLQNEGAYDEAEILASQKSAELQALMAEKVRQQGLSSDATALERSNYGQTAGQYAGNYQSEINNVLGDNDTTNDWQADILGALRQQKITDNGLDQQGNKIATDEGMISTEAQEALSAYNSGFRTQGIIDILTNAGYDFPSTSSGSGSGSTTTETNAADNIVGYNELGTFLDTLGAGVDPNTYQATKTQYTPMQKIEAIQSNYSAYTSKYGKAAVEQMVEDLYNSTLPQEEEEAVTEEVGSTTDYKNYIKDNFYKTTTDDDYNESTVFDKSSAGTYILNQLNTGLINEKTALYLLNLYEISPDEIG